MKRLISLLLLVVLFVCLLGGCGSTSEIELMNTQLTIEFTSGNSVGTVTTGDGDVYEFRFRRDVCEITYPDGSTYSNEKRVVGYNSFITADGDGITHGVNTETAFVNVYAGDEYLPTSTLADAIELAKPEGVPFFGILFSLGLIVVGIVMVVKSHSIMEFRLEIRNWHKDPNMREYAHARTAYTGIILAVLGLLILIIVAVAAV